MFFLQKIARMDGDNVSLISEIDSRHGEKEGMCIYNYASDQNQCFFVHLNFHGGHVTVMRLESEVSTF